MKDQLNLDLKEFAHNHRLCLQLSVKYMLHIVNILQENKFEIKAEDIKKYIPSSEIGTPVSGAAWLSWFLDNYMPKLIKEEEDVSER